MATKYWLGLVEAVASVQTATVDTYDAASTYKLSIGIGNKVVEFETSGDGSVNATAAALKAAADTSTHPYAAAVTWTNSTNDIVGTADNAGEPFTAALTVTGGTGTVTDFSDTTAMKSPNDANDGDNYSDGSVPGAGDTLILRQSNVDILWNLESITATGVIVHQEQTYTGKIGLNSAAFLAGGTENPAAPEYRPTYFQLDMAELHIGEQFGPDSPAGSTRAKWDNDRAGASTTIIYRTADTAADTGLPAVRLLANHASADLFIRSAEGGVGVAVDEPGETSTLGTVKSTAPDVRSTLFLGGGVTVTTFEQTGGDNHIKPAAAVTTVSNNGGILHIEGDQAVTTLNANAGTTYSNTTGTITTANVKGELNLQESSRGRTITNLNLSGPDARFLDNGGTTLTNGVGTPSTPFAVSLAA